MRTQAGWASQANRLRWRGRLAGIDVLEWRCDRCGAAARQPCRMLRFGERIRPAHLARWSTAVVFTLATRWLTRLPVRDRLVLATRAVGNAERRPDGEPVQERPAVWTDATALLWQADLLQRALVHRVVADADGFVDAEELRRPGLELAAAMKETGDLLRQQYTQGDPRRSEVETMVLPGPDGPHRRRSLAELRAARDLGQVQVMTADMAGRAAAVAAANGTGACRWAVRWDASGRFDAEPVPAGDDGTDDGSDRPSVLGWAAHPAVVADELGRWSTGPRLAEVTWQGAPPSPVSRLCALPPAAPRIAEDKATAAFWAQPDRLAEVVATIDSLRRSCPADEVRDVVAARAARLQAEEPQLPDVVAALAEPGDPWACTTTAEWVRTRAVVHTPDEVWGRFGRDVPGEHWLPERTSELLAVQYADVPAYLIRHFAAHSESAALLRVPGPAGPLYSVGPGGSHDVHLCRILGLPWMFAITAMVSLPRRIDTTAVTPAEYGPEGLRATAELWQGLLARGIVHGELIPGYSDWGVELRVGYALAPWMLLPADRATAYNQRYELLYPGALAAAGIPDAALHSPTAWWSWLTRR